jgi:hypothetical protein
MVMAGCGYFVLPASSDKLDARLIGSITMHSEGELFLSYSTIVQRPKKYGYVRNRRPDIALERPQEFLAKGQYQAASG